MAGFASMHAAQAQVVISQVYGGGGATSGSASYRNDYVELYNRGTTPVALAGLSLQYASATGTGSFGSVTALPAVNLQPGQYFLVQMSGGTIGAALPAPDATGTIAMSASAGKVVLARTTTSLGCNGSSTPCSAAQLGLIVDLVGYGTANFFEGSGAAPGLSNTSSALRQGNGATDTDNNAADFQAGAPTPRNSGSIVLPPEPVPALTIAQIQGNGLRSPHVGEKVVTEGIVTAQRFNNGFFLQAQNEDGEATTSDAVFVFTGTNAIPASAAIGNRVRVTGKVEEFTPATALNQLSVTELTSPTIELLATGATLPAAIELTATDLNTTATPGTLERYEAMRVSVANSIVVGASQGRIDEPTATASSDGVFHVTLPTTPTPFREPGIGALDVTPIPAGVNPPRFDTNPERLMVRSRGQVGALPMSVDNGAQVAGLVGVLDYTSANWALLPDAATPPTATGGRPPEAVHDAAYEAVTVGGFNLLRFFDDVADGNGAPTLQPTALQQRLAKTGGAICDYLKTPDILGVVEVENLRVLGMLADRINSTCASAPGYVPYLVQGNDIGGINVGFLVSTRPVSAGDNGAGIARVEVLEVTQHGKDTPLQNPDGSTSLLNDRPPLLLRAIVHQDNGASYPITVIANHLRSLNGNDSTAAGSFGWSSEGARVRGKRGAQALYLANLVEQEQQAHPGEKLVLLGDFNAFEFNDGYTDVMGIVRGDEAGPDQVLNYVDSPVTTPLVDGSQLIADPAQRYSYVFDGNAQTLDHVLVNQSVLGDALSVDVDHARINADFGVDNFGDNSIPVRVSDHDPVRVTIAVPSFRSADLSLTASATSGSVHVGDTVHASVDVASTGPNAAQFAAVAFVFDAQVNPSITAPADWSCAAPVVVTVTTTVTCTTTSLAANATAHFDVAAVAPDSVGGGVLRLAAAVSSMTADRRNGDSDAALSFDVAADADLAVGISGPTKKLHYNRTETFRVTLDNAGPDAAWQPVVVLHGDAPAGNVAIAAPAGWTCDVGDASGDFEARCNLDGAFAANARQRFDFDVRIPARSNATQFLTLTATATAATPESASADNQAQYRNRIVGVP
ncbi:hypothetical protein GCM10027432_04720 [Lysobacter fragariae]